MAKTPKRPRDVAQLAKLVTDIATGQAQQAISEYIEVWYNRKRRHSSLGGKSPAEYEQQLALIVRAA